MDHCTLCPGHPQGGWGTNPRSPPSLQQQPPKVKLEHSANAAGDQAMDPALADTNEVHSDGHVVGDLPDAPDTEVDMVIESAVQSPIYQPGPTNLAVQLDATALIPTALI